MTISRSDVKCIRDARSRLLNNAIIIPSLAPSDWRHSSHCFNDLFGPNWRPFDGQRGARRPKLARPLFILSAFEASNKAARLMVLARSFAWASRRCYTVLGRFGCAPMPLSGKAYRYGYWPRYATRSHDYVISVCFWLNCANQQPRTSGTCALFTSFQLGRQPRASESENSITLISRQVEGGAGST